MREDPQIAEDEGPSPVFGGFASFGEHGLNEDEAFVKFLFVQVIWHSDLLHSGGTRAFRLGSGLAGTAGAAAVPTVGAAEACRHCA